MGEHVISEKPIDGIASGTEEFSYSASRARKGQRPLLNMGQSPIPPLLEYENGIVWGESICGRQSNAGVFACGQTDCQRCERK